MRGKSKYHSKKTVVDNIEFDSLKEASRYKKLKEQEQAGKIKGLRLQVKYELIPKQVEVKERYSKKTGKRIKDEVKTLELPVYYIADFVYKDEKGQEVVEDVKGMRTPDYVLKRKLMLYIHGIKINEV
jgi:hypothetical protein